MKIKISKRIINCKSFIIVLGFLFISLITNNLLINASNNKSNTNLSKTTNIINPDPKIFDSENIFKNKTNNEKEYIRLPNKLKSTSTKSDNSGSNNNLNKGVPKAPSKARASVIENVNNANKEYPIYRGYMDGSKTEIKYAADARQFITFQTKNGKTFHLVINHDEENNNVMLLTEVSEDDLLNMVEKKEIPKKVVEEQPKKVEKEPVKTENKSELGTYLVIGVIAVIGVIGAYFFKKHKKEEADNLASFEENDNELEEIYEIEDVDINEVIDVDKEFNNSNNLNSSNNNQNHENKNSSSEFDELDQNLENDEDHY